MTPEPTSEDIKKKGEDKASHILTLLADSNPIDIYKAICSIKCAEVLTRAFATPAYPGIVEIVATFVETTMKAVDGNEGDRTKGMAILSLIEFISPFKPSPGAEPFAVRMQMFDTMILESAKKLGVEAQAKGAIDTMSAAIFLFLIKDASMLPRDSEVN